LALAVAIVLLAGLASAPAQKGSVLSGSVDDEDAAADPAPPSALPPAARDELATRFDAALRMIAAGKERAAAEALLALAQEAPQSELAPESLFEAGLLYEDHLSDPETARRCYQQLVANYPRSRLLRRAKQRLEQLELGLRTGAAPLKSFHTILRTTVEGSRDRRSRLEALLAQNPDFALADQVLFLLADTSLRGGDRATAMSRFNDLYRRFPTSHWAAQGHRLHAETLLGERHILEARTHYQALEAFSGPLFPLLAREGLIACDRAARAYNVSLFLWAFLGLLAFFALYRGWRHLWPPPYELLYYLPVAGLMSLAALLMRSGNALGPIWQFGLLGSLLTWLGAASSHRPLLRPPRRLGLVLGLVVRAAAAGAIFYLIIYHHGLIELIADTLRNGPDADG
jgi:hypothetical protein